MKIRTVLASAAVLAIAATAPVIPAMAATAPATRVIRVTKPVTVVLPSRSEDDDSRSVAIYRGVAHIRVGGTDIRIYPAGPRSHGDYSHGAWRLVLYP